MCCDSWGRKESDMTEQLNCTNYIVRCPLPFPCLVPESWSLWLNFNPRRKLDCALEQLSGPREKTNRN